MAEVSIIVPVYNVERYLARALDSCINQTFEDVEIICVNDGSTDRSLEILEAYAKYDSRIKIICKENGGLSSARNVGIENATGKYLLVLDSDDYLSSVAVELLYNNAVKNDSDVVIFDYYQNHFDQQQRRFLTVDNFGKAYENEPFNAETIDGNMYKFVHVTAWSKLYKTEFLKNNNISYIEGVVFEDVPYWAEVFVKAKKITYLQVPLYSYTVGRASQIMANNDERLFDVLKVYEALESSFRNSGYYEKFKHSVQILRIMDSLKKYDSIRVDLRESLFNKLREISFDVDWEYFANNPNVFPMEKNAASRYKLLKDVENYSKFVELSGGSL